MEWKGSEPPAASGPCQIRLDKLNIYLSFNINVVGGEITVKSNGFSSSKSRAVDAATGAAGSPPDGLPTLDFTLLKWEFNSFLVRNFYF